MKLMPTRYEALIEIDPKAEFKATPNVVFVIGSLGKDEKDQIVWEAAIGAISIRKATDPRQVKAALSDALRKTAAAIDASEL